MMTTWIDLYNKASKPQQLLALLFVIATIIGLLAGTFILLTPEAELLEKTIQLFHLQSLEAKLKIYLSPAKINLIGSFMVAASAMLMGLFLILPKTIFKALSYFISEFLFVWHSPLLLLHWLRRLPLWEKVGLLSVLALLAFKGIYYILLFDLQYDEAWTYQQFISRGPFFCVIAPHNNHPIYSIVSSLLCIFPMELKWQLRLPVLLAGLSAVLLMYPLLRKYFNGFASLASLSLFAVSPVVTFYMMFGRGYMFGILGFIALLLLLERSGKGSLGFLSASILTIYSLPTMILPWSVIAIEAFFKKKISFKLVLVAFTCCVILYMPVLLSGASKEFTQDSQWTLLDMNAYVSYFHEVGHFLNCTSLIFATSFVLGVWYALVQKSISPLILLMLPMMALLLSGSPAPERVWSFLCVPQCILLGFTIEKLIQTTIIKTHAYFGNPILGIAIALLVVIQLISSDKHDFLRWSETLDHKCNGAAQTMITNPSTKPFIYNYFYYIQPILHANFIYHNIQGYSILTGMKSSKDYIEFDPNESYTFVIVDSENPKQTAWLTAHDTLIWNEYFGLLKRK